MVSPLPSARSSSSKTGSETTYFSLAQLPRSRSRQRSLQNGKSAWTAESVSALQMGHLCFMIQAHHLRRGEYSSGQDAERRARGDAMELLSGWNRRTWGDACNRPFGATRQNFRHTPNQVVCVRLRNFYPRDVPSLRHFSTWQFNIRQVQLPINLRRHSFQ